MGYPGALLAVPAASRRRAVRAVPGLPVAEALRCCGAVLAPLRGLRGGGRRREQREGGRAEGGGSASHPAHKIPFPG